MELWYNAEDIVKSLEKNKKRYVESRKELLKAYQEASDIYQQKYRDYSRKVAEEELSDDDKQPTAPEVPKDRTGSYDLYISMIKDTIQEKIILNEGEYNKFFKDDWAWMQEYIWALRTYATNTTTSTSTSSSLAFWADSYENGDLEDWN